MSEAEFFHYSDRCRIISKQLLLNGNVRGAAQDIGRNKLDVQAEAGNYIQHLLVFGKVGEQMRMFSQSRCQALVRQVMY